MSALAFHKRHLIAHKLSVVDQDYITKAGDTRAVLGRKIVIDAGEVEGLALHPRLALVAGCQLEEVSVRPSVAARRPAP